MISHTKKFSTLNTWGLWFRVIGTLIQMSPTELGQVGQNEGTSVRLFEINGCHESDIGQSRREKQRMQAVKMRVLRYMR